MNNELVYEKYLQKANAIFSRYQGKYLVVDNDPVIIEGKSDFDRFVLIQFPSKQEFENWYYSDDYQEILKYRLEGADCNAILVESL